MYISASALTLALEVDKLTAKYGRIPILNGVTFTARAGEVLGILGYNGMGKTTLMKVLIGLLPSSGGTIRFESRDITRETAFLRSRAGIGYVPQGREVFPRLSVRDNLRMGASALGAERDQVVRSVVAEFPILERLYDRMAGTLSGGEQQILAIARALCARPRLLLLDEPTEGIQPSIIHRGAGAVGDGRQPDDHPRRTESRVRRRVSEPRSDHPERSDRQRGPSAESSQRHGN
jgi:branched-chain amino acid transport system ATP-binding protein